MAIAGIDFGTTNSTAGLARQDAIDMLALGEDGAAAAPSVLFFDAADKRFSVGREADRQLRAGHHGRYMRSLKTYLGRKDSVSTRLAGKEYSLEELIAQILSMIRGELETQAGEPLRHVVIGRPVRFNDDDDALDRRAEERLAEAARIAGLPEVSFQYEPIAAALAYEATATREEVIMVADIGGGTSDFSVVRVGPDRGGAGRDRSDDILGGHGVYIGGDDFDASIINGFVAPELGRDSCFRSLDKRLPIPVYFFNWLSRWHLFNNLLDPKNVKELKNLLRSAEEPEQVGRLLELVENQIFFDFISVVETTKKNLSRQEMTALDMALFSDPFVQPVSRAAFEGEAAPLVERITGAMTETLQRAGVAPEAVDRVFLTGGTTLVRSVRQGIEAVFSPDRVAQADVFASVGYGLVRAAQARAA